MSMQLTNVPEGARYRLRVDHEKFAPAGTVFVKREGESGYGYYGENPEYSAVCYAISAVESHLAEFERIK